MKGRLKGGLALLFLSLLLLGVITIHTVVQIQSYGKLINYVGIVRGATQRLVKLELEGFARDDILEYLDGILLELNGEEGAYGLPSPRDARYQEDLTELNRMWEDVRESISAYRAGLEDGAMLLETSEAYFEQANKTVFSAEAYSSGQSQKLLLICAGMFGIMLLTWSFIFWAYAKKLLLLESTNEKLNDLAKRDPLTGAYQMDVFREEAQRLLEQQREDHYAVLYTDFADFKYFNDVYGYTFGDDVLAHYGGILSAEMREGELFGRVAADNFVLLLRYREKGEITVRQRRADREIEEYLTRSRNGQSISTCCGICCVEDVVEALNIDGFLDRANFARKTVKNGTNPNYVYYNEKIRQRLWAEKRIENRIQEALDAHEFEVFYQPKVLLSTGQIACSEALVRWRSAEGNIVSPDLFIPVFERKFMINRLDQYVFEEVCRWLHRLLLEGKKTLPVSVNVSRLQFYDQDFVHRYVEIRDRYEIPPELLEIEFTESILVDNTPLLLKTVGELKKAGFSCSIDDFGKGYSSLSLLKNLPVDVLKIDRLFFVDEDGREQDLELAHSVIDLVRKFHIRTVAEGVESEEQVEQLKEFGCDYVQGYVFYRPMPQEEYEGLLSHLHLE